MSIEVSMQNGMKYELIPKKFTAHTVYSPQAHGDIIIPKSILYNNNKKYYITKIGAETFKNNQEICSVQFPEDSKIKSFENSSFYGCSIKSISIPRKVKFIGESAFFLCYKLKTINLPIDSKLVTLDSNAISFSLIESLFIPSKVEELKNGWCCSTKELNEILISPQNPTFSYLDDEKKMVVAKSGKKSYDLIFACRNIEKVCIRPDINRICVDSFMECVHLTKIEFSENSQLEYIEDNAFRNCSLLESISIPFRVKKIGGAVFSKCGNLQKVEFSEGSQLEKIEKGAFAWTSIQNIVIPRKTNHINRAAFLSCEQLKSAEILGDNIFIDDFCFKKCKSLLVVSIPNVHKVSLTVKIFNECSNDFSLFISSNSLANADRFHKT